MMLSTTVEINRGVGGTLIRAIPISSEVSLINEHGIVEDPGSAYVAVLLTRSGGLSIVPLERAERLTMDGKVLELHKSHPMRTGARLSVRNGLFEIALWQRSRNSMPATTLPVTEIQDDDGESDVEEEEEEDDIEETDDEPDMKNTRGNLATATIPLHGDHFSGLGGTATVPMGQAGTPTLPLGQAATTTVPMATTVPIAATVPMDDIETTDDEQDNEKQNVNSSGDSGTELVTQVAPTIPLYGRNNEALDALVTQIDADEFPHHGEFVAPDHNRDTPEETDAEEDASSRDMLVEEEDKPGSFHKQIFGTPMRKQSQPQTPYPPNSYSQTASSPFHARFQHLTEAELRAKLKEIGLTPAGDKNAMVSRLVRHHILMQDEEDEIRGNERLAEAQRRSKVSRVVVDDGEGGKHDESLVTQVVPTMPVHLEDDESKHEEAKSRTLTLPAVDTQVPDHSLEGSKLDGLATEKAVSFVDAKKMEKETQELEEFAVKSKTNEDYKDSERAPAIPEAEEKKDNIGDDNMSIATEQKEIGEQPPKRIRMVPEQVPPSQNTVQAAVLLDTLRRGASPRTVGGDTKAIPTASQKSLSTKSDASSPGTRAKPLVMMRKTGGDSPTKELATKQDREDATSTKGAEEGFEQPVRASERKRSARAQAKPATGSSDNAAKVSTKRASKRATSSPTSLEGEVDNSSARSKSPSSADVKSLANELEQPLFEGRKTRRGVKLQDAVMLSSEADSGTKIKDESAKEGRATRRGARVENAVKDQATSPVGSDNSAKGETVAKEVGRTRRGAKADESAALHPASAMDVESGKKETVTKEGRATKRGARASKDNQAETVEESPPLSVKESTKKQQTPASTERKQGKRAIKAQDASESVSSEVTSSSKGASRKAPLRVMFTNVDASEAHEEMIRKLGGEAVLSEEHDLLKHKVSHLVCLPNSLKRTLKLIHAMALPGHSAPHVVHLEWLVDSAQQSERLPEADYAPYEGEETLKDALRKRDRDATNGLFGSLLVLWAGKCDRPPIKDAKSIVQAAGGELRVATKKELESCHQKSTIVIGNKDHFDAKSRSVIEKRKLAWCVPEWLTRSVISYELLLSPRELFLNKEGMFAD